MSFRICTKCTDSNSSSACAKSYWGICSKLIQSVVSNDFVSGHRRSLSDCADAQADLGHRCPYMPEDTFLQGMAQLYYYEHDSFDVDPYYLISNLMSTLKHRKYLSMSDVFSLEFL